MNCNDPKDLHGRNCCLCPGIFDSSTLFLKSVFLLHLKTPSPTETKTALLSRTFFPPTAFPTPVGMIRLGAI